jgi:hypothetical protein
MTSEKPIGENRDHSKGDKPPDLPGQPAKKHWVDYASSLFEAIGLLVLCVYAGYTVEIYRANKQSADAATSAAKTATDSLVLAERPWVKISHRIVRPLTFGVPAGHGPVASIVVEDNLENVGATVALHVLSWEDVVPIDADHSLRTAYARRSQWCDAHRNPDPAGPTGYVLFPHDPMNQQSTIGPEMADVERAANASSGRVGFVLVGCVCYRSSFEPPNAPTHQTRFIYFLGDTKDGVGSNPYVEPTGIASGLRLLTIPDGLSAD